MANLTTVAGISYQELARNYESGQEHYDKDEISAVRVFKVAWTDRLRFIGEKLGGSRILAGTVVYQPPEAYPDVPFLLARRATVRGLGIPNKLGTDDQVSYDFAETTIEYSTHKESDEEAGGAQPFLSERIAISAEFLTLPENSFKFKFDAPVYDELGEEIGRIPEDDTIKQSPGKIFSILDYQLTLHKYPLPPWADILDLTGKINEEDFAPLNRFLFPNRTLLFQGAESTIETTYDPFSNTAISAWTITYRFAFRRVPWTFVFQPRKGIRAGRTGIIAPWVPGWTEPVDGENKKMYLTGDFTLLLPGLT